MFSLANCLIQVTEYTNQPGPETFLGQAWVIHEIGVTAGAELCICVLCNFHETLSVSCQKGLERNSLTRKIVG